MIDDLPRYNPMQTYDWNYVQIPLTADYVVPEVPGKWHFCGLPVQSPLGIPAGPLLNSDWILYYASLGFDVLTYKTVRSRSRLCYPMPNLQPVICGQLSGREKDLRTCESMRGSWAVSFGMPSKSPDIWRRDVETTRRKLSSGKVLVVSVVGTVQEGWTIEQLAHDYAQCARWAVESGADCVETNLSCPNVSTCDGQVFQQPLQAAIVAAAVRNQIGRTPFIIKIGHVTDESDAAVLIDAVQPFIDAIALTNSVATTVRNQSGTLLFDGQRRGICGDGVRSASVVQTQLFHRLIKDRNLPIRLIGVGGVQTAEHVRDYLRAGASSVQLATAAMVNPAIGIEIRERLASVMS